MEKKERKILKFGAQAIAVHHFTNDITSLPFIMDSNCFIVFSLLWRRYDSHSLNKNLIKDGWFQYTMKSLMKHCGFKDKGTLQRTVEGLYRSGIIDVRVESGSRLWACWKLNKEVIEKIASLTDRDSMDEPFLNSIRTIESKDKEYTYLNNKEGINELMKFFSAKAEVKKHVNPSENPPLFNTITLQHNNTIIQQHNNTITQQDNNTITLQHNNTITQQDKSTEKQQNNTTAEQYPDLKAESTTTDEFLNDVVNELEKINNVNELSTVGRKFRELVSNRDDSSVLNRKLDVLFKEKSEELKKKAMTSAPSITKAKSTTDEELEKVFSMSVDDDDYPF